MGLNLLAIGPKKVKSSVAKGSNLTRALIGSAAPPLFEFDETRLFRKISSAATSPVVEIDLRSTAALATPFDRCAGTSR